MERVTVIQGKVPIILVCPHGADDINTDIITECAANTLQCNAVINRGFERADFVDVDNDKANCNRIDHIKEDVVCEEFLQPIEKIEKKLRKNNSTGGFVGWNNAAGHGFTGWFSHPNPIHIFHIHGCGNAIHKQAGVQVGAIVGYGLGLKKDSLSCDLWRKNLFVHLFRWQYQLHEVLEGKRGGKYTGRDANNMNQYYRKHKDYSWVQSMQLEFPFSTRDTKETAKLAGANLAVILHHYLQYKEFTGSPDERFI